MMCRFKQKTEKLTYPTNNHTGPNDTKTDVKVKSSEGSGMETDQTEQLDVPLTQCAKVLDKNQDAEKLHTLKISKKDNRSLSPLDRQNTLTASVMAEKKEAGYL